MRLLDSTILLLWMPVRQIRCHHRSLHCLLYLLLRRNKRPLARVRLEVLQFALMRPQNQRSLFFCNVDVFFLLFYLHFIDGHFGTWYAYAYAGLGEDNLSSCMVHLVRLA